jgi:hypothetical protein
MAVALLAASVTGLRRRVLAQWVCLAGRAAGALMAIDIVEDLVTTGTNLGSLGPVAFGLANVWIVARAHSDNPPCYEMTESNGMSWRAAHDHPQSVGVQLGADGLHDHRAHRCARRSVTAAAHYETTTPPVAASPTATGHRHSVQDQPR